ncbi:hypothetical protein B0O99DRAFT_692172 [Bisporella sp. PMI_857]|nr:hypothetical protein B0O99DRAFT_692172 [Bisporella sp. PMI_857]
MICAHIGTGFSAGATFFDTSYCNPGQTSDIKICPPRLSVNPWVIDVIIVVLIVQALTIVFVITQWWKKPSGFSADPTSIAGIAAFMGHPEVEQEFVLLPTEITTAGLKRRLRGKKFRLGQFATERGDVKYGIMPADDENEPAGKDGFFDKLKDWWAKLQGKYTFLHNWKKNRLLFDAFFVALLLALLGLIIDAVSRVNKTEVVFLATTAASDAQTFAPYINLGRGSSNPDATILLKRHSIPFTAFLPLLWHRHYTPASVAFIGLIAELLVVALSGLPYRPGQQRGEFLFWGITSLVILTIMVAQLISISMWRRKLPHLPRAPESIAAVMPYVAGTSMSRDFNGLEQLKRHERDKAIRDLEKSYAYGWRKEEDGRVRWIVDEVPRSKDRAALIDGADHFS